MSRQNAVSRSSREWARIAGLRYFLDDRPGIRRVRGRGGFRYLDPDGKPVKDAATLARIRSLAVPPGWADVWVCPRPDGHLQATGRDAAGRKQYRYHPRWHEVRSEAKYARLLAFAEALPRARQRVEEHLAQPGLPRTRVLATVVRLLERTAIRVGNEEYARVNRSFGLTTLQTRHVRVDGATLRFSFRGKSGVRHRIAIDDPRLARIVRRCQELPGQELFQYVDDDGEARVVDSADVNEYLREITGTEITAKDFRTWAGTAAAFQSLLEWGPCACPVEAKRNVIAVVEAVARQLGNTPAVCRKCYIHPAVLDAYLTAQGLTPGQDASSLVPAGLGPQESVLFAFLSAAGGKQGP